MLDRIERYLYRWHNRSSRQPRSACSDILLSVPRPALRRKLPYAANLVRWNSNPNSRDRGDGTHCSIRLIIYLANRKHLTKKAQCKDDLLHLSILIFTPKSMCAVESSKTEAPPFEAPVLLRKYRLSERGKLPISSQAPLNGPYAGLGLAICKRP